MNEIMLRNEFVGGPFDGDAWLSDWVPHWVQEIGRARARADRSCQWAEYRLKEANVVFDEGVAYLRFQYQFVGLRESYPSWSTWVLVKSRRWRRRALRCVARLLARTSPSNQNQAVDASLEPAD